MYYDERFDNQIKNKMKSFKLEALIKIQDRFKDTNLIENLASLIVYGYFESYKPAENMVMELDFQRLEMLAIQNDFHSFKEEYLQDLENDYLSQLSI